MPLNKELSSLLTRMTHLADDRSAMTVKTSAENHALEVKTRERVDASRKLLDDTAEMAEGYRAGKSKALSA